jgi:ATP-binding cassette, subfamily C (CFTR/MRP), member 1
VQSSDDPHKNIISHDQTVYFANTSPHCNNLPLTSSLHQFQILTNKQQTFITILVNDKMGKLKLTKRPPTPEQNSSCLNFLFFGWLTPMFTLAIAKRKSGDSLELNDLWQPIDADNAKIIAGKFMVQYEEKLKTKKEEKEGILESKDLRSVLISALFTVGWTRFVKAGCLKIFNTLLQFMYPICVNQILIYIELVGTPKAQPIYLGYLWAVLLGAAMLTKAVTENHYFHLQQRVAWQTRTAIQAAIYRKSLRLSAAARQTKSVGQLVNLMQIDAMKIEFFASQLHMLWDGAFQILGYLSIVTYFMGPSALVGALVMAIAMPAQGKIMKSLFALARSMVKFTDARVKTTNEALQGIRCVKYYNWEGPLKDKIQGFRNEEIKKLKHTAYVRAFSRAYMSAVPAVSASAAFATYALTGGVIKASILFTVLQGFSQLRFPLLFYPMTLAAYANAKVGLIRIGDFLGMENVQDYVVRKQANDKEDSETMVKVENAEFWWEQKKEKPSSSEKKQVETKKEKKEEGEKENTENVKKSSNFPILQDISFDVKKGQLTCFVGGVGCGKSSLMNALLGEMIKTKGSVEIHGNGIAYCGQSAWILNSTVKENIVFNEEYDEEKYYTILKACQLESDLMALDAGDATEIGERGINLSGGQKQRISLARAAYSSRDIFLLDDPLSALDPSVANKVFNECIKTVLKGKTILMVTNQLQFVSQCDQVIVLKAGDAATDENGDDTSTNVGTGRIVEIGAFDQLMKDGKGFSELIKKSGTQKQDDSSNTETSDVSVEVNGANDQKPVIVRKNSIQELKEILEKKAVGAKKLMEKEEKRSGGIKASVYAYYIKSAGGVLPFLFVILWYVVVVGANFVNTVWVSWWTEDAPKGYASQPVGFYVIGYAVVAFCVAIFTFCRTVLVTNFGLVATKSMHTALLNSILGAPMSFFDTTPIGRIIARFSSDIHSMDTELIQFMDFVFWCGLYIIATFSVITYVTPWFAVAIPVLTFVYYNILYYFRSVYLGSKRLDSISKSPVFAHFSETLGGLSTIRAYNKHNEFMDVHEDNININIGAYYLMKSCDRWLSVRLEALGGTIATLSSLLAVVATSGPLPISSSIAGLSIYYASTSTGTFSWFVRQFAALENAMNSVERVQYYSDKVPQEESAEIIAGGVGIKNFNEMNWPVDGAINISNLKMRYRKGLPLVLNGLNVNIPGGSRVGIVGRTGCGKSSLMLCLLRLVEPEIDDKTGDGPITLDKIDISKIPLSSLRTNVGIIPQNPTLFSGTIRSNLDPFGAFTDDKIWDVLGKCGLKNVVQAMDNGLESKVAEYGENLSQGQRQLLCLGRVLMKNCKVLLLDEATSSVDFETDEMIQDTLRKNFENTTVLTIAHRVNTIMDSDLIMVLDDGKVAELGSPAELLENDHGHFNMLVHASKKTTDEGKKSEK